MPKNVGTIDALIRITLGLLGLAWAASNPRGNFSFIVALLSAMKVAEGVVRFCPVLMIFGRSTTGEFTRPEKPLRSITLPAFPQKTVSDFL